MEARAAGRVAVVEQIGVHACPEQGMVIGRPAHHHPVHVIEVLQAGRRRLQTTVQFDREGRTIGLELMDQRMAQGGDGAVLLGIKPFQPGFPRMHGKALAAGRRHRVDEVQQRLVGVMVIDADPVLHRDRQAAGLGHGRHAAGHPLRISHQTGAEAPLLHLLAGAAHVEVDLVVAPGGSE